MLAAGGGVAGGVTQSSPTFVVKSHTLLVGWNQSGRQLDGGSLGDGIPALQVTNWSQVPPIKGLSPVAATPPTLHDAPAPGLLPGGVPGQITLPAASHCPNNF